MLGVEGRMRRGTRAFYMLPTHILTWHMLAARSPLSFRINTASEARPAPREMLLFALRATRYFGLKKKKVEIRDDYFSKDSP